MSVFTLWIKYVDSMNSGLSGWWPQWIRKSVVNAWNHFVSVHVFGKSYVFILRSILSVERSKRFILHPPADLSIPKLFNHISTAVYSQIFIYTAEWTWASWRKRKCPTLEKTAKEIRTRALSVEDWESSILPLSYYAPHASFKCYFKFHNNKFHLLPWALLSILSLLTVRVQLLLPLLLFLIIILHY